jgi:hypothetical protein
MLMPSIVFKSILTLAGAAALAVAAFPSVASAGEVNNRVHDQQQRIDQGFRSGQLTPGEYNRDEARLNRIDAQRERDLHRNDGRLTAQEQRNLNRRLNTNSRDIYYTKHNRRDQPGV